MLITKMYFYRNIYWLALMVSVVSCSSSDREYTSTEYLRAMAEEANTKPLVINDTAEKSIVNCVLGHIRPKESGGVKAQAEALQLLCNNMLEKHGIVIIDN